MGIHPGLVVALLSLALFSGIGLVDEHHEEQYTDE